MNLLSILIPAKEAIKNVPKVELSAETEESYYTVARWIMKAVYWILDLVGLEHNSFIFTTIYAILVLLISIMIGYAVKWIIIMAVDHLSKVVKYDLYIRLRDTQFFVKVAKIVPPIVFVIFIQFTLYGRSATLASWLSRITWIYIIYCLAVAFNTLAMVVWSHIDARENKKKLPLKGLVQLVKGIIWILAVIIIIGILVNKSPGSLLTGLGAFAAVLMLVFKDSILGVVAGVQLSENDSLHVGDWIKVPGTDANGNVIEVSLTSVKVQNFDKTVTTVPPYSLISGSFTNYRPMQLSKTRRICRSYLIDSDSILPTDEAMLTGFAKIPLLTDWINKKLANRKNGVEQSETDDASLADGNIDTNLGVFRAYVKLYLDNHPNISHNPTDTCFVSTLAQTAYGVPFQVYCFTDTSAWVQYENIQSAIFEHLAIMMARFRLYTNENASGRDEIVNGILEAGADPQQFFGLPYPFLQNGGTPQSPADGYPNHTVAADSTFPSAPVAQQPSTSSPSPSTHS